MAITTTTTRDTTGSCTSEWPDWVGKTGEEAKAAIQTENSNLFVVLVHVNAMVTMDYRLDRVRIYIDDDGKVDRIPTIG